MNASNRKNNVWAALVSLVVVVLVGIMCMGSFLAMMDNAPRVSAHAAQQGGGRDWTNLCYTQSALHIQRYGHGNLPCTKGALAYEGRYVAPSSQGHVVHHVLPTVASTTGNDSSTVVPAVADNNVPATVISNDSNNVAPIVVVDTCENGNPGNKTCHGNAGEDPNGKGTMPKDSTDGNGEHGNQGNGKDK